MIEKERLEELIEQGATVCNTYKDWDNVWHCRFGNVVQEENHLLFKENGSSLSVIMYDTNNLYETKEHAEWEWEFGCIEITERLELPTWEELFEEDRVLDCYTQEFGIVKNRSFIGVVLLGVDFTNEIVEVSIGSDQIFCELLTKENYTLACRKAKELFLGEKK